MKRMDLSKYSFNNGVASVCPLVKMQLMILHSSLFVNLLGANVVLSLCYNVNILPEEPVCLSGNICGLQEWGMSDQVPCELSSGASLLWMKEGHCVGKMYPVFLKGNLTSWNGSLVKEWTPILPVKGWSSTRLQPLALSNTLYLVTAGWDCRLARTLVTPSPVSLTLKRGLSAIWNKIKGL